VVAVWVDAVVCVMNMFVDWGVSCAEVVSVHRFFMSLYMGLSLFVLLGWTRVCWIAVWFESRSCGGCALHL